MSTIEVYNNSEPSIFIQRLRELRTSNSLTLSQFAEKAGVSKTALSNYERRGQSPSMETLLNIARTYNVSLDWLCGMSERKVEPFRTQADFLLALLKWIDEKSFSYKMGDVDPETDIKPLILSCDVDWLNHFMCKYEQMDNLRKKQEISQEIFDTWLSSEIAKREDSPFNSFEEALPF